MKTLILGLLFLTACSTGTTTAIKDYNCLATPDSGSKVRMVITANSLEEARETAMTTYASLITSNGLSKGYYLTCYDGVLE